MRQFDIAHVLKMSTNLVNYLKTNCFSVGLESVAGGTYTNPISPAHTMTSRLKRDSSILGRGGSRRNVLVAVSIAILLPSLVQLVSGWYFLTLFMLRAEALESYEERYFSMYHNPWWTTMSTTCSCIIVLLSDGIMVRHSIPPSHNQPRPFKFSL